MTTPEATDATERFARYEELERGRVAEIGRHDELLARPGGVYARLYAQQMFERQAEEATANQP
mgnify:CR=1 FL=1